MTDIRKQSFDWQELVDIFRLDECGEEQREALLRRINALTVRFGREYVIRKIALRPQP